MTTETDLEDMTLNEICQTEKDKYCVIPLNVDSLKKKKSLNGQKHRIEEWLPGCQRPGDGRSEEVLVKGHKRLVKGDCVPRL